MSMVESQLVSSKDMGWETPDDVFGLLNRSYQFDLDAAANASTKKCHKYIGPDHEDVFMRDSLSMPRWPGSVIWLNPPYGREIGLWMDKAVEQSRFSTVAVLTFARTDTRWWHRTVSKAAEVRFLSGRIKFLKDGNQLAPAPAPSALITFARWSKGPPVMRFGLDSLLEWWPEPPGISG